MCVSDTCNRGYYRDVLSPEHADVSVVGDLMFGSDVCVPCDELCEECTGPGPMLEATACQRCSSLLSNFWKNPVAQHCKKRGVTEHPRGAIFYCFRGNSMGYHGNSKILLPWGVQLHHIFYSELKHSLLEDPVQLLHEEAHDKHLFSSRYSEKSKTFMNECISYNYHSYKHCL